MRIAYLLTQDLESPSGLGRYLPLALQMARRGHQVRIAALHPDIHALSSRNQSVDGIEVKYVAPMHVRKQGNTKVYYHPVQLIALTLRAAWGLSLDACSSKAQILHVGKPHPMNSVAGLLGSFRPATHLCVDCDDYEAGSMHFTGAWQRALITYFEKRVPKLARLVSVNTQFMRQKLCDWGIPPHKIIYLPNGVDRERFQPQNAERLELLRRELGLEGKQVVAYIGSLSLPSHPLELLLHAFTKVHEERPDTILLIVGGGADYQTLVEMAAKAGLGSSVVFTGRVAPQDVVLYYHLADVSVDPVYADDAARGRSPLKLFESWATGVPFITSRVGDRIDLLETSQAGVLTSASTPEAYAQAILSVLASVSLRQNLRARGLMEVQNFTWEHLVIELEQAYLRVLDGK